MAPNKEQQEFLTLYQAAKLLQISEKTLTRQAKAGEVPHFKVGKQYRFVKAELLSWATAQAQQ